jgi:hypothetical protein
MSREPHHSSLTSDNRKEAGTQNNNRITRTEKRKREDCSYEPVFYAGAGAGCGCTLGKRIFIKANTAKMIAMIAGTNAKAIVSTGTTPARP